MLWAIAFKIQVNECYGDFIHVNKLFDDPLILAFAEIGRGVLRKSPSSVFSKSLDVLE